MHDGNLLDAGTEALVNAVNTKGVMGRGLAAQFKARFPDHFLQYRSACQAGEVRIGEMLVTTSGEEPQITIIHFPTKGHWRSPSRLPDIEAGLRDLRIVATTRGLRSMAVPALGCGLGGLPWDDVRPLIESALHDLPTEVLVYAPRDARPQSD